MILYLVPFDTVDVVPVMRSKVTFIHDQYFNALKVCDQTMKMFESFDEMTLLLFPSQIILADQLHQVTTEKRNSY